MIILLETKVRISYVELLYVSSGWRSVINSNYHPHGRILIFSNRTCVHIDMEAQYMIRAQPINAIFFL